MSLFLPEKAASTGIKQVFAYRNTEKFLCNSCRNGFNDVCKRCYCSVISSNLLKENSIMLHQKSCSRAWAC